MSATRAQQVGIWIIAVVLAVGTIGGFIAIILANDNQATQSVTDSADQEAQLKAYQEQQKAAAKANADNSIALEGYSAETFDAASVTSLQKEILVDGTGDEVKSSD